MSEQSKKKPWHKKVFSPTGAMMFILLAAVIGVLYVVIHGHANDGVAYVAGAILGVFFAVIICILIHSIKVFVSWSKARNQKHRAFREYQQAAAERSQKT